MSEDTTTVPVTVYWRPGCGFCARLRRDLHRTGLPVTEIDIWDDPAAAAAVRSIAGGNETVPTVTVDGRVLVNPSARAVVDAVGAVAPELIASGRVSLPRPEPQILKFARWLVVGAGIAASFALESAGHGGASWLVDGLVLTVYVGLRGIGRRFVAA